MDSVQPVNRLTRQIKLAIRDRGCRGENTRSDFPSATYDTDRAATSNNSNHSSMGLDAYRLERRAPVLNHPISTRDRTRPCVR